MGLRARIIRVTAETGPRPRQWLSYMARGKDDFDRTFERMREKGEIVMYGSKRGATWGVPKSKRTA